MKPQQIQRLQELARCYMRPPERFNVRLMASLPVRARMNEREETELRRLWHLYQPQIIAMRRNRTTSR